MFSRAAFMVFLGVLAAYLIAARKLDLTRPIGFHHQIAQADAFLHGRLHLEEFPPKEELVHFEGRAYVAAPPGPALILLPFVLVAGPHFNPLPLHMAAGALSAALIWAALRARGVSTAKCHLLALGVAFGTVLWWCTRQPGMWHTAHVLSFLLLSLALWVTHARSNAFLAGLLVGGSALCRQLTLFAFPFFLYRLIQDHRQSGRGQGGRPAATFSLGLALPVLGYLLFNWARFGSPFETGYQFLYLQSPGLERFQQFGLFHPHYLPENLYTLLFAAPRLAMDFPYLAPDLGGQALIFTSPFLLYALCSSWRDRENWAFWICIALILGPQLLYFNNGFAQFGYRFALDFLPLAVVLAGKGMPERPTPGMIALVGISMLLNAVGVYQL